MQDVYVYKFHSNNCNAQYNIIFSDYEKLEKHFLDTITRSNNELNSLRQKIEGMNALEIYQLLNYSTYDARTFKKIAYQNDIKILHLVKEIAKKDISYGEYTICEGDFLFDDIGLLDTLYK